MVTRVLGKDADTNKTKYYKTNGGAWEEIKRKRSEGNYKAGEITDYPQRNQTSQDPAELAVQ